MPSANDDRGYLGYPMQRGSESARRSKTRRWAIDSTTFNLRLGISDCKLSILFISSTPSLYRGARIV